MPRLRLTLVITLLLSLLLTQSAAPVAADPGGLDPAPDARMADLERDFLTGMIPHHRGASMMAEMAVRKATKPELRRLAQQIIDDQRLEIDKMSHFLRDWYGVEPPPGTTMPMEGMMRTMMGVMGMGMSAGTGMSMPGSTRSMESMPGMDMSGAMGTSMPGMSAISMMPNEMERMRALEAKTGADFDVEFMSAMIDHHAMAVMMAAPVLINGHHADLVTLAENVVISQGQEIRQMDEWLNAWYGVQRPL